jgi:hypothetical protein
VTFENVPAFAVHLDAIIDVPTLGKVTVDVAWGGMFYVIADVRQFAWLGVVPFYPLMDAIMTAPFIQAVKTAPNAVGFPVGGTRAPLLDLDPGTAEVISSLAAALKQQQPVPP